MKLTIPVSRYNLSVDSSSSVSVECGRTDLISIPASAVIVGKKKKGAKPWDRGKRVCFLKCRKCLSCNLNVQLINFEFSGSKVLSWRAALFPHCGSNMTPWSKCRVWHMRQKRGLSYCTEGQRISKVPWKYVFGKIILRETAASIRATVLKESVKSFRQRNTLGFCTETLLKVRFPQQRSGYSSVYWTDLCSRRTVGIFFFLCLFRLDSHCERPSLTVC